mgnify:FL=1
MIRSRALEMLRKRGFVVSAIEGASEFDVSPASQLTVHELRMIHQNHWTILAALDDEERQRNDVATMAIIKARARR